MAISIKAWKDVFIKTIKKFSEDDTIRDSAAIAFYTIFSLPGITLISMLIASSFFYEDSHVKSKVLHQLTLLMGQGSAKQVEQFLGSPSVAGESLLMKILGYILLIISATTVFIVLQDALNKIWRIKPKPRKRLLKFLLNRVLSLEFVVAIGFLILVSLALDTITATFKAAITGQLKDYTLVLIIGINFVFSLIITFVIFAAIFKKLPDVEITWRDVSTGAIVTTVLFTLGKYLVAFYLDTADFDNAYGAAGSLVALLAWIFFSVIVLFFGAQFTYVHNLAKGRKILPSADAVGIKVVEVEANDKSED